MLASTPKNKSDLVHPFLAGITYNHKWLAGFGLGNNIFGGSAPFARGLHKRDVSVPAYILIMLMLRKGSPHRVGGKGSRARVTFGACTEAQ